MYDSAVFFDAATEEENEKKRGVVMHIPYFLLSPF
jgi:hypothetical protein